jgi:hypothetical protein
MLRRFLRRLVWWVHPAHSPESRHDLDAAKGPGWWSPAQRAALDELLATTPPIEAPDPSTPEETPPMSDQIPRITAAEFQHLGFLQEVNRLFLHPLGLALEVIVDDDGTMRFGGVWDYREDPEGMLFADLTDVDAETKALVVEAERQRHVDARNALFGQGEIVQPIGHRFDVEVPQ